MTVTIEPGQVLPDVPHFGGLFPLGTDIAQSLTTEHYVFTNEAPTTWMAKQDHVRMDNYYFSQPLYLRSGSEVTIPSETARQFYWRLRDSALGAAERSGVRISAVQDMCRDFGADEPLLVPGGVVSSKTDLKLLPRGSVVYLGHPDRPDVLNVWEVNDQGGTTTVLGTDYLHSGTPVTIHSIPGVEPVVDTDPVLTPEQWARIALRAWRVGKNYQANQGWCSVFDYMLTSLGITEATVAPASESKAGPGEVVDRICAAQMPEGTLLWHQWRGSLRFAVYQRVAGARNSAGTKRVCGWDDDGENSHDAMRVIATPSEPMLWKLTGLQLAQLPDGTTYRHYGSTEERTLDAVGRAALLDRHTYSVLELPV